MGHLNKCDRLMFDDIRDKLTIIIVSFNSGEVILNNLGGLIRSNICDVIVVDNASTDDSRILLRDNFHSIDVIDLPVNVGYGRAANIALKKIDTDYGLLLNPDVALVEDSLKEVFENALAASESAAVFSPALRDEEFFKQGNIFVEYLIGAFLLFKMDALKNVGYFEESIFLFYEEKDLEARLIDHGYKLILQSDIYVRHFKSSSTKSTKKIVFLRNWHVAWSALFYSYKHSLISRKISGYLLAMKYGLKAIFNVGDKRIKYKARFLGTIAYMKGEKAFSKSGYGQHSEKL